ncbi:hypothetical protein Tco_0477449 [Tanacetum coccineum]
MLPSPRKACHVCLALPGRASTGLGLVLAHHSLFVWLGLGPIVIIRFRARGLLVCGLRGLVVAFCVLTDLTVQSTCPTVIMIFTFDPNHWLGGHSHVIIDIKSVLSQESLDMFCQNFHIPNEVHPQLPSPNQTIHEMPTVKIGMQSSRSICSNFFDDMWQWTDQEEAVLQQSKEKGKTVDMLMLWTSHSHPKKFKEDHETTTEPPMGASLSLRSSASHYLLRADVELRVIWVECDHNRIVGLSDSSITGSDIIVSGGSRRECSILDLLTTIPECRQFVLGFYPTARLAVTKSLELSPKKLSALGAALVKLIEREC